MHPLIRQYFKNLFMYILVPERKPLVWCLDEKLPRCKAQAKLQPERTLVREDCRFVQQRRRWGTFRSNTILASRWLITPPCGVPCLFFRPPLICPRPSLSRFSTGTLSHSLIKLNLTFYFKVQGVIFFHGIYFHVPIKTIQAATVLINIPMVLHDPEVIYE